jgi:hypothetical protein
MLAFEMGKRLAYLAIEVLALRFNAWSVAE